MFLKLFRRLALALALVGVSTAPAHADWLKAESERFIVYSEGHEGELRQYVQRLESFDRVLRLFMSLPVEEAPPRKLPIYLVNNHRDLLRAVPGAVENQWGVYFRSEEDIFAVARHSRSRDGQQALLHEYAHHFMFQNFSYVYPAWFVEGFAEFYSTAEIASDRIDIGRPNDNQVAWLQNSAWIAIEDLLAGKGRNRRGDRFEPTYYPLSWLLTHWFMADPARRPLLAAYLRDVGAGGDPVEAMERSAGLTPQALRDALRSYLRNRRISYARVPNTFGQAEVSIERLPASADSLLLIHQQLKIVKANRADASELIQEVARLAANHPQDPFALRVHARAELHAGETERAETLLQDLVRRDPADVEALQMLAELRLEGAMDHPDGIATGLGEARAYLAQAFAADDANFRTFLLLSQTREGAPGYPNENDLMTWRLAHALAPQLSSTRFGLAGALLAHDQPAEAIRVLEPLANDPHSGASEAVDEMINEANRLLGQTAPSDEGDDADGF